MKKIVRYSAVLFVSCFLFFISIFFLSAKNETQKNTICLNMIVKNEKDVIEKCLASVKGFIDYWVIVDTGSTDGTQEIIKNYMQGIPGELHERPWVDFGHNRDEALQLAKNKAEYTLFIDADETLVFSKDFIRGVLDKDVYGVVIKYGQTSGIRDFLVRNALSWHWKGVLHEVLECKDQKTKSVMPGVVNYSEVSTGARAKNPKKHLHDALALKKGLEKEPDNLRYQFHLAQCYTGAEEFPLAIEAYEKRLSMGEGSSDEYFYSLYMKARLQARLQMPLATLVESYQKAHAYRPWRIEPLFHLGFCYIQAGEDLLGYETLKKAVAVDPRSDDYFNKDEGIVWQLHYQLAGVCWRLGKVRESLESCERLMQCSDVPQDIGQETKNDIVKIRKILQENR